MATATREDWLLLEEAGEASPMPVIVGHRYCCSAPLLTIERGAAIEVTRVVHNTAIGWRQVETGVRGVCPIWLFRQHFATREGEENG